MAKAEKNETTSKGIPNLDREDSDDKPHCMFCDSDNVYGMSRVVGYYSIIGNWNKSKKAELKRRQDGNYWYDED